MKLKIALVIVFALYISIFLHEMGHCLVFRHNGIEVEKVSVAAIWELKLTVFTDSQGTQYEVGPLPVWGYTRPKEAENVNRNLAKEIAVDLAGLAVNTFIVLLLTFWFFLLRKRWRERGMDFTGSFPGKVFKVFVCLNFFIVVYNALWLAPATDGGSIIYFILSQRFGKTFAENVGFVLGVGSFIYLWSHGIDCMFGLINKIYGWTGWPGPRSKKKD